ncbi:MAG: hypothetical protein ACK56I_24015 [bacterium]
MTHRPWRAAPSACIRRPMASPTAPPAPASASSKISTGTGFAWAAVTAMASPTRESSPPEAIRASGRAGTPACGAMWKSTRSPPLAEGSPAWNSTAKRAPAMPRSGRRASTPACRAPAAWRRAAARRAAQAS